MRAAIEVEGLGKSYRVNHEKGGRTGYRTLRDSLADWAAAPLRRLRNRAAPSSEEFWALRDVNFEVRQGEVVGIIGRNGAGKSTLLKILSRITKPTKGRVRLYGRVSSLLEVGSGFHAELTGRENIFLNGSILGMSRREIVRKFDEIVAFAEIERFLDTPVKRYSSGMYVRLAFAVAAHLEPEILLVDEVLAVGDLAFQKKCMGKMEDVAATGRTVFFVSHNIGALGRLCTRGIYLEKGWPAFDGPIDQALGEYVRHLPTAQGELTHKDVSLELSLLEPGGERMAVWRYGTELVVRVQVRSKQPIAEPAVDLAFYSDGGARVFALQSDRFGTRPVRQEGTCFRFEFRIKNTGIACPQVSVDVGVRTKKEEEYVAWWQRVETLPTSLGDLGEFVPPETLVYLPCRLVESGT